MKWVTITKWNNHLDGQRCGEGGRVGRVDTERGEPEHEEDYAQGGAIWGGVETCKSCSVSRIHIKSIAK